MQTKHLQLSHGFCVCSTYQRRILLERTHFWLFQFVKISLSLQKNVYLESFEALQNSFFVGGGHLNFLYVFSVLHAAIFMDYVWPMTGGTSYD